MYNLYIQISLTGAYNIFGVDEDELQHIVDAYESNATNFTLNGTKYDLGKVNNFKIYEHNQKKPPTYYKQYFHKNGALLKSYYGEYVPLKLMGLFGKDVTKEFLKNRMTTSKRKAHNNEEYISKQRIDELRSLTSENFDFSKVIKLCEEVNDNYSKGNYYSVSSSVRTILNHIPPIFGQTTFSQVIGNHGTKSFKSSMNNLDKSLRVIADGHLHDLIRKKIAHPTKQQVDFSSDLDVLLGEIISVTG